MPDLDQAEASTAGPHGAPAPPAWRILSVDDDTEYRRSLAFSLDGSAILGHPVELLEAGSYAEASALLTREPDIAVVLLDVVMETDDAGLRLVRAVRDVLGNDAVRIVLLSGQLGMEPLTDVFHDYDVNDCWTKSELTAERLHALLSSNIRTYEQIRTVARARRGLQLIVESTNALFNSRSIDDLASTILMEIGTILDIGPDGVVCVRRSGMDSDDTLMVIGATGRFVTAVGRPVSALGDPSIVEVIASCLRSGDEVVGSGHRALPFRNQVDGSVCVVYLAIERALDATEMEILRVFTTNIRGGLHNVALVSRLDAMAYSDPLLGIPNRNALVRGLNLGRQSERSAELAFALVDVDNFASLNAALGTDLGDDILRSVARRLRDGLGREPLIARVANDLFGIIGDHRTVTGPRIVDLFAPSYETGEAPERTNVSVGAVTLPLDRIATTAEQAINHAVIALRAVKRRGIGQHGTVDTDAGTDAAKRFATLDALRRAIAQDDIRVVFQPQIDLATGAVCGLEMLARWTLTNGLSVRPDQFIPLAETSGLILPLGETLFERACAASPSIDEAAGTPLRIAVNVSGRQFAQRDLLDRFERILDLHGITPDRIEIEITETIAMGDGVAVQRNLERCREIGLDIAIDDFGTGFASLSSVRRFPAQRLKIDRSFVDEIGRERDETAIADMVVRLGRRLNMSVLAEGVETAGQAAWLRERGCHEAQGYLFAKPMPLDQLLPWLAEWTPEEALRLMELSAGAIAGAAADTC